ncbi:MAG: hypothetical protein JWP97_5656 [Labilithrix sp.]|nr:hypothetical protein [Labilithrix sp.]
MLLGAAMPTLSNAAAHDADELPADSQFESFYDEAKQAWTLRRIPSAPPCALPDDGAGDGTQAS